MKNQDQERQTTIVTLREAYEVMNLGRDVPELIRYRTENPLEFGTNTCQLIYYSDTGYMNVRTYREYQEYLKTLGF